MSAPTGSPGPYGPSGPYVQPGYPPNVPPMAPGGHVPSFTPAPVSAPPRSNRPLIVVAVLLGLAVILSGSYVLGRLAAPTAPAAVSTPTATASASAKTTATATKTGTPVRVGFTLTGSALSGPGFTAKMPSGWTLAAENGVDTNDGVIENGSKNTLAYFASDPSSATTRCHYAAENYRAKLGGAVVDLPAVPWGNGTAVVKELKTKYSTGEAIGLDIYCVDRPGNTSAVIFSIAAPEHQETNKAAAEGLLASWVWT